VLDYSGSTEETLNLTFYPLLWQAGGTVFTPDGRKSAFSSPEGVAALRFLVELKAMNGLPRDVTTKMSGPDHAVATGRAAMAHAATAADAKAVIKAVGAENTAVGLPLRQKAQVTFGQPGALALSRNAKGQAKQLLSYLSSPQVVDELCALSEFFPPWPSEPAKDELSKSFAEALPFASAGDPHPQARKAMSLLAPHLQAALLGRTPPEQALADAAREVDGIIGSR
jgi:multiple sugar transport system substrate-binding protein